MSRNLLIALLLTSVPAGADEIKSSPRYVSVMGTATSKVQADTVVWHIQIRRMNKDLAKAQAESDEGVKKVLALKSELNLTPEDLQTGYMSIQKVFDRDQFGNQTTFRHFEINRSVTIRQRDISRFDAVLAKLISTADIDVNYTLESSELQATRNKTRLEAVSAARKKATEMTELLGAKIFRVLRIVEPPEHAVPYMPNVMTMSRQGAAEGADSSFVPGTIEVKVSIEVAFEIE